MGDKTILLCDLLFKSPLSSEDHKQVRAKPSSRSTLVAPSIFLLFVSHYGNCVNTVPS